MKLKLGSLLLLLLLLSACSSKRYGHYGYLKRQSKKTIKLNTQRKSVVKPLAICELIVPNFSVDSALKEPIIKTSLSCHQHLKPKQNLKATNKNYHSYSFAKQKVSSKTDDENSVKPNVYADVSMTLSILSIFFLLGSVFYLPLLLGAFILGLLAYDLATNALDEIDKFPKKYSNRNAALFGKVIGGIYRYALIVAAAVLGLLILIGVIILIGFMISVIAMSL